MFWNQSKPDEPSKPTPEAIDAMLGMVIDNVPPRVLAQTVLDVLKRANGGHADGSMCPAMPSAVRLAKAYLDLETKYNEGAKSARAASEVIRVAKEATRKLVEIQEKYAP